MVFVFFLCRYLEVLSSLTLMVILSEKIFSTSIYPTHQLTANRAYRFTVIQALILKQDRTNYIQTILDIRLFNLYLNPSGMAISTMSLHTVTVFRKWDEKFIHFHCSGTISRIWSLPSLVFALDLPSSVASIIPHRLCFLEFTKVTNQS